MNRFTFAMTLTALWAAAIGLRSSPSPAPLQYLTTAHQAGPVGLRDPFGAVSPDGQWLAYVSNRHLYLHQIPASLTVELFPAADIKTAVRWYPDSQSIAVQEKPFAKTPVWFRYNVRTGQREPLAAPPVSSAASKIPNIPDKLWGGSTFQGYMPLA